jgi:hypothetical protein
VSDFQVYERAAMRRGAQVRRLDNQDVKGPGMAWQADFEFRGKKRALEITLEDYEAPTNLEFLGTSGGLSGACEIELIARPQTLSARLLVQSLKLAKGNLDKKFDARVAELSDNVAAQYRQTA